MKSLVSTAFLLLAASVSAAEPAAVMVSDGHVRAMPPTVKNTAAYFTLHNHGEEDITLIGVSAEFAERIEVHETTSVEGQLVMHAAGEVTVPAMGSLVLENGGLHLMVMGLSAPLAPGQEVTLLLEFSDGAELPVTLPVMTPMLGGVMESGMDHDQH